jgi:uncharacterized protein (DUF1684 family)
MKTLHLATAVIALLLAVAAPACAKTHATPAQEWEKWRQSENAGWSTDKYALLKIDDAIYLKPGDAATLALASAKPVKQYKFTLEGAPGVAAPASAPALRVAYDEPYATVTRDGKAKTYKLGEKTVHVPLGRGIEFGMQLAQVTPGKMGLRAFVFNQANSLAKSFTGLEHFPFDPAFVVTAAFEPAVKPEGVDFQTSRGWYKRFYRAGIAVFTLGGKEVRLPLYAESDEPKKIKDLSTFFLDDLTGKETYGVGRYVNIDVRHFPPRTVTIDFNRAYNPNCARSPHYNCPVATDMIPFAIRAGEKKPPGH